MAKFILDELATIQITMIAMAKYFESQGDSSFFSFCNESTKINAVI